MTSFRQDVNVGLVAFVGVVGAMILLISALGVQAWFGYETDLILQERYATDDNEDWRRLKSEQYANIGDRVGNDTIYAASTAFPTTFNRPGDNNRLERGVEYPVNYNGYRFIDDERSTLAVPIHDAMAAIVAARGGPAISAEEMAELDRGSNFYVHLKNEVFRDPQSYVELSDNEAAETSGQSATDGE